MKPVLLTETFEEFIRKCKRNKTDPAHTRSVEERERTMRENGRENRITDGLRWILSAEIGKYCGMVQEKVKLD